MAGTKEGGKKAAATNKLRHGDGFYARIGKKGGEKGHTGGFAANPKLARVAGRKGGTISSRAYVRPNQKQLAERRAIAEKRYAMHLAELEEDYDDEE